MKPNMKSWNKLTAGKVCSKNQRVWSSVPWLVLCKTVTRHVNKNEVNMTVRRSKCEHYKLLWWEESGILNATNKIFGRLHILFWQQNIRKLWKYTFYTYITYIIYISQINLAENKPIVSGLIFNFQQFYWVWLSLFDVKELKVNNL